MTPTAAPPQTDRLAVTGVGLITGAGATADECWTSITAGQTGIRKNTLFDTSELLTDWAGRITAPQSPDLDRCYSLAATAFAEALEASGLGLASIDRDRVGLVVGSSLGAMPTLEEVHRRYVTTGELDAATAATSQLPSVADFLAAEFGVHGPRVVTSNACAAGAVSIGYAAELLWNGDVDYVVCGGVDPLATLSAYGFTCLGALDPEPCSPLSASTGLTLGEGAGFMVLERTSSARRRGAEPLAEVAGYGLTCDGYHQTAPDPGGIGASSAMAEALRTAGLDPTDVDYINLHGTGTPTNDSVEPKALRLLFGSGSTPPASSTKSMLGHTLGAAGSVEAICSILAISRQALPPTINTRGAAQSFGLDIVPEVGREAAPRVVVSNSFAFGGNNASLVLTAPGYCPDRAGIPAPREVVVTGVAGLAGSAADTAALTAAFAGGRSCYDTWEEIAGLGPVAVGRVDTRLLGRKLNPAKVRRMDPLSILSASVVNDLYARHGKPSRVAAEQTGIVFGTGYGPVTAVSQFHRGVLDAGIAGANPLIFPNTVTNAAAGHLAMGNRYRGYTATLACGGSSSILALQLATRVIARGAAERIMIVIADEFPELGVRTAAQLPGYSRSGRIEVGGRTGTVLGEGAAAVLLESADSAQASGTPVLARVLGFGASGESAGLGRIDRDSLAWSRSMHRAVTNAGLTPAEIGTVVSAASGYDRVDAAQAKACSRAGLADRPTVTPKRTFGETYGSAGALGLVALIAGRPARSADHSVLVSTFAYGGSYAAAVVEIPGATEPVS